MRRARVRDAAVAALAALAALVLVLVALDALRWERALAAEDRRFEAAPGAPRPWSVDSVLPGRPVRALLAVDDDLAYRRTLREYWRVRPGQTIYGPELENVRVRVETDLARVARSDPVPGRRSAALNLLGVLAVGVEPQPQDANERAAILRTAISLFRTAAEIDPGNVTAKHNLELALRDAGAAQLAGDDPSGQAALGSGAGAGRSGSGY